MSSIHVKRVTKSFGSFRAVNEISFEIEEGEFVTLLGGSGSGKTTCLRIVAGFVKPDQGHIYIGGQDVTTVPPYRRNTGMVFQNYALFPHLTGEQTSLPED
jgi:ABC-type Fe3+/spermidine/putrescine transport system ATPase subunit